MRRLIVLAALAALLLVPGCGGSKHAGSSASATAVPELTSIDQLRGTFNAHQGLPRLIVLISPT